MEFLFSFLRLLLNLLTFAIVVRVVLSWLPVQLPYTVNSFLYSITEPILAPLRQVIPRIGMLDISPLIAILLLQLIVKILSL